MMLKKSFRGLGKFFPRRFGSTSSAGVISIDHGFEDDRIKKNASDPNNRDFTYFMLGGSRLIYASAVRLALVKVFYFNLSILFLKCCA